MDKATILAELKTKGQIDRFTRTPEWERAFDLYNSVHGTKLRPSCGSCFRTVKAWLQN